MRTSFYNHISAHGYSVAVYTDGSKTESEVRAAAVFPDRCLSHSLQACGSVYTAELVAILMALCYILFSESTRSFVIFSDSRSSLQSLKVLYPRNPLVTEVQRFLQKLHSRDKKVSFCWIPAHVGIPGNERADREAKLASSQRRDGSTFLPEAIRQDLLPYRDFLPFIRCGILDRDRKSTRLNSSHRSLSRMPSSA